MASGLTNSTGVVNNHAPIYTTAKDRTDSNPSTRVSYLDDLADFSVAEVEVLYKEHNKPCVYDRTGEGGVAYHLKWDDWSTTTDNTASTLDGTDGDVCIEMDRVWWKAWKNGNYDMFSWTYEKPSHSLHGFKPWAHYKGSDNTVPHIYPGAFKFAENSSYLGSYVDATAKPARSQNMTSFETNCKKLVGTNNKAEYTLARMATYTLIREMHDAVSKSTDSQGYFGNGVVSESGSEANLHVNSDGYDATHMMRAATPITTGKAGVNSLGFNNLWGNVYEFCGQAAYANRHFKCNYLNDAASYVAAIASASYSTLPSSWYETTEAALPMAGAWQYPNGDLNEGPCAAMAATTTSGSGTSTYYCDGTYMPVSATNNCVRFGGALNGGAFAGLRCCYLSHALSDSDWHIGARLLIIPPV